MNLLQQTVNDLTEEVPLVGVGAEALETVYTLGALFGGEAFEGFIETTGLRRGLDIGAELGVFDQDWANLREQALEDGTVGEYLEAVVNAATVSAERYAIQNSVAVGEEDPEWVDHGGAEVLMDSIVDVPRFAEHYVRELAASTLDRYAGVVDVVDGPGDQFSDALRDLAGELGGDVGDSAVFDGSADLRDRSTPIVDEDGDGIPDKVYTARSPAFGHVCDVLWLDSRMMLVPRGEVMKRLDAFFRDKFAPLFREPGALLDVVEGPSAEELHGVFASALTELFEQVTPDQYPEIMVALVSLWGATGDQGQRAQMRYVPHGLAPQHPRRGRNESWHHDAERLKGYDHAMQALLDWQEGKGTDKKGLPYRNKSAAYKAASLALSALGTPSESLRDPRFSDSW